MVWDQGTPHRLVRTLAPPGLETGIFQLVGTVLGGGLGRGVKILVSIGAVIANIRCVCAAQDGTVVDGVTIHPELPLLR